MPKIAPQAKNFFRKKCRRPFLGLKKVKNHTHFGLWVGVGGYVGMANFMVGPTFEILWVVGVGPTDPPTWVWAHMYNPADVEQYQFFY